MIAENTDPFERLFSGGSRWLRADFHLHTKEDRQFENPDPGIAYEAAYVERLAEEQISIGVITNHNKFILSEFKNLRKQARKRGILLLPGVELSIQGGRSGVHVLICFEPSAWIDNKEQEDFINRFLDKAFDQIANRESEDTNCHWTLGVLLEELKKSEANGRRAFVVPAHVDESKGMFKEMGAGIGTFFNESFRHFILGVQKASSHDNWNLLKQWTGSDWKPAKVEGSDGKSLAAVGVAHRNGDQARECWLKLGSLSYDAVQLALQLHEVPRVASTCPRHHGAFIQSMTLEGKLLPKQRLEFNADMSNLIGVRGSGKSSLIECTRYALDLKLGSVTDQAGYKEALVERTLGSGGKIMIELVDRHGEAYTIERVLRESPKVTKGGETIPNLKPASLITARYFGQKDLVQFGEKQFAHELIERFTETGEDSLEPIRNCEHQIEQRLIQLKQGQTQLANIEEIQAELAEAKVTLEKFEELKLGEKLKRQIALEKDLRYARDLLGFIDETSKSLSAWHEEKGEVFHGKIDYKSASAEAVFEDLFQEAARFGDLLNDTSKVIERMSELRQRVQQKLDALEQHFENQRERFAEIRRNVSLQGDLTPDTFIEVSKKKAILEAKLKELEKLKGNRETMRGLLLKDLHKLQDLWREDYLAKKRRVEALNAGEETLAIEMEFKGDKTAFLATLKNWTSGLQARTLEKVAEHFADGVELFLDLQNGSKELDELGLTEDQIAKLRDGANEHLFQVVTYRPGESVRLAYKDKPLYEHSLGQRATALMLFLLSQEDVDLLVIDQPEDDLDNQTLYSEVISRLLQLKGKKQFVFATHSPNIPVLGDAEQIVRCQYTPDAIQVLTGTIDSQEMQREIIDVMEGGDNAFRKRKQIYESWNH